MLYGEKVPKSSLLLVAEEGLLFSEIDYSAKHVLLPREQFKDIKKPERILPCAGASTSKSGSCRAGGGVVLYKVQIAA